MTDLGSAKGKKTCTYRKHGMNGGFRYLVMIKLAGYDWLPWRSRVVGVIFLGQAAERQYMEVTKGFTCPFLEANGIADVRYVCSRVQLLMGV